MLHQVDLILWLHFILCKCCVQTNLTAYLPSTPVTSSRSQSHSSASDYPKHCRDTASVSRVLRCDTGGWHKTGRLPNFQEPGNTYFNWQIMNQVSFTNSSWAANIFLSLHCNEKNPQVLPLHCAWIPLFQNRSIPPHTSPCRQKTGSTTHLQKLPAQDGTMLTYNYMRKKKEDYGKNTTSVSFLPWEKAFSLHPTRDAIRIFYIHTHTHHIDY